MKDMTLKQRSKMAYALAHAVWESAREEKADYMTMAMALAVIAVTICRRSGSSLDEILGQIETLARRIDEGMAKEPKTGTAGTGGSTEGA